MTLDLRINKYIDKDCLNDVDYYVCKRTDWFDEEGHVTDSDTIIRIDLDAYTDLIKRLGYHDSKSLEEFLFRLLVGRTIDDVSIYKMELRIPLVADKPAYIAYPDEYFEWED